MYKVMLVDDDYPVLEFLSEMIDWKGLGMTLQSVHANGLSALAEAEQQMPDILITDIGMPKINGIELTKKLKEKNPSLLVSILSCHNEFEFAQAALKLNVQEYILKDLLELEQIEKLLRNFKDKLDLEKNKQQNFLQMVNAIEQNKESLIEKFFHKTIYQPIHDQEDWYDEAEVLGFRENLNYIPVLCVVDNYQFALQQLNSQKMLALLLYNVITEVIQNEKINGIYGHFETKESFLFVNEDDPIKSLLQKLQLIFQETFGFSLSFIIGSPAAKPTEIKNQMTALIRSNLQEFYLKPKSIVHLAELLTTTSSNTEVKNACRYILDNLHRKITLDEVANYLHLNSSYFSRLFKKEMGENFVKYVVNIKMNRAKELLEQTNCTILEISEMLGYENQSYFNKTFKGSEGIAPMEYRNRVFQRR